MSNVRIVTLDHLLDRLKTVLGPDSLLYHRFEEGLRFEDERSLTDAMRSLRLYPDHVRSLVENTVMSWLFGSREEGLTDSTEISQGR